MDSENQQSYLIDSTQPGVAQSATATRNGEAAGNRGKLTVQPKSLILEGLSAEELLTRLQEGIWVVSSRRRNGLILYKGFHAEFAGPGAAVGGMFDRECHRVLPVGDLSLRYADTHEERQKAYLIRRQWIRLTQQFTDQSSPQQRAQMILTQFENYFDQATIARIPDEAFALMVGVLPYSVRKARRTPGKLNVRVKT